MGQWKDGNKDGEGIAQYANGDRYEGMWRKDAAHGRGTLQYTTGDVYEGDWKDNLRHGSGTFTCAADGKVYAGEFADVLFEARPRDADAALRATRSRATGTGATFLEGWSFSCSRLGWGNPKL